MTAQKQSWPSFVSIISTFSIVLYCAGFLRVELELNEQKKRISALENVVKTNPSSDEADIITFFKNVPGKFVTKRALSRTTVGKFSFQLET